MIGLVIVASVRLYREGLSAALALQPGVVVLAGAAHPSAALNAVREHQPDVVLVDMAMSDGLNVIRALEGAQTPSRSIALAVAEDEAAIIQTIEAGACGYVSRNGCLEDVANAARAAARGEMLCSPGVAASLVRRIAFLAKGRATDGATGCLTPRELEILAMVDQGLSNKEIAHSLHLSVLTVKTHVHHVLEKLDVHRRGEAAARLRESLG